MLGSLSILGASCHKLRMCGRGLVIASSVLLSLSACSNMSSTQQRTLSGGAIGAAGGAAIGALSGGSAGVGALIGGAAGAGTGYLLSQ